MRRNRLERLLVSTVAATGDKYGANASWLPEKLLTTYLFYLVLSWHDCCSHVVAIPIRGSFDMEDRQRCGFEEHWMLAFGPDNRLHILEVVHGSSLRCSAAARCCLLERCVGDGNVSFVRTSQSPRF
jgi:hypothetical protein